jgi:hypothetical protein
MPDNIGIEPEEVIDLDSRLDHSLGISFLLLSLMLSVPMIAISQEDPVEPVVHVSWERQSSEDSTSGQYSWDQWEYALASDLPQVDITYENGSNIETRNYRVNRNDPLLFIIVAPKEMFPEDAEFEGCYLGFNVAYGNRTEIVNLRYEVPHNRWKVDVEVFIDEVPVNIPDPYTIFTLDTSSSHVTENEYSFNVTWAGHFGVDASSGLWSFWTGVYDSEDGGYYPSFSYWMPIVALESDEGWQYRPIPQYKLSILDNILNKIEYVEADESFILELQLDQEISYALIELGIIAYQSEYRKNITSSKPIDRWNETTDWMEESRLEPPRLAFHYNGSTAQTNAVILYYNYTYEWIESRGDVPRQWEEVVTPVFDNTNLSLFYTFDAISSGPVDQNRIWWNGSLTEEVLKQQPVDWLPTDWFPTYGGTFQIPLNHDPVYIKGSPLCYAENSGYVAVRDSSLAALESLCLRYHDVWSRGSCTSEGLPINGVEYSEWFNVSVETEGALDLLNSTGIPWWREASADWRRYDVALKQFVMKLYGEDSGENSTHYWGASLVIDIGIDVDTHAYMETWILRNVTRYKADPDIEEVVQTDSATSPLSMVEVSNISLLFNSVSLDTSFQMHFSENAFPDSYWFNVFYEANTTTYISSGDETGPWVAEATQQELVWFGNYWHPNSISVGIEPGTINVRNPAVSYTTTAKGALDLDGDLETTDDQYCIRRLRIYDVGSSFEEDSMKVDIVFDPTPSNPASGDEFTTSNWMGLVEEQYSLVRNHTYFWYHASDMTPVSISEMEQIEALVWLDKEDGIPYINTWDIAAMTVNGTWPSFADLWWGEGTDISTVSWFGFGMDQDFNLQLTNASTCHARFRSDFAGLFIFQDNLTLDGIGVPDFIYNDGVFDSQELTHIVLVEQADDISFTSPTDSPEPSGQVDLTTADALDFGVRLENATCIIFPTHSLYADGIVSFWSFIGTLDPLSLWGLDANDFDASISHASIDVMSFDVHYGIHLANTTENPSPNNHQIEIKVDQRIGQWEINEFAKSVLEGRCLATAYLADLGTTTKTELLIDETPQEGNDVPINVGDLYNFGADNYTFASVRMGGQKYTWGKDDSIYNCSAATVPISVITAMHRSEIGTRVTTWDFETTNYFMLSGFPNWDGYSIINDPSYRIFSSALGVGPTTSEPTEPTTVPDSWFLSLVFVVLGTGCGLIALVLVTKSRRKGP